MSERDGEMRGYGLILMYQNLYFGHSLPTAGNTYLKHQYRVKKSLLWITSPRKLVTKVQQIKKLLK